VYLCDGSGLIMAHASKPTMTRGQWTCLEITIEDLPVLLHSLVDGKTGYFKWDRKWYGARLYEIHTSRRFTIWDGTINEWIKQ